ncbi:leukocyte elastase inhibitor B-like [Physella acuta]|uniref:leukocyte elastase inhibitor B-like n=1 Tax=Physella acuta TaxID=109671 RepID=UPI0027DD1925|nr:leukocyte elastase inhibitor B-like [Physella acuta]
MLAVLTFLASAGHLVYGDRLQPKDLSEASTQFSQALYGRLAVDTPNSVYSPFCIHAALTMMSLGARGQTSREMTTTLRITDLGDAVHEMYRELITDFNSVRHIGLSTVNTFYMDHRDEINPVFIHNITSYYKVKVVITDVFHLRLVQEASNDVRTTHTTLIYSLSDVYLLNAVVLEGSWERTFSAERTRNQTFYKNGHSVSQVALMNDERTTNFKRDNLNEVDVVELPLLGGRFCFYIVLPQKVDGIKKIEELLVTPGKVEELLTGLTLQRLGVSIPKIDVHETGISAATGVITGPANVASQTRKKFLADHPFVYFLRDKQSGHIVLQGKFSG